MHYKEKELVCQSHPKLTPEQKNKAGLKVNSMRLTHPSALHGPSTGETRNILRAYVKVKSVGSCRNSKQSQLPHTEQHLSRSPILGIYRHRNCLAFDEHTSRNWVWNEKLGLSLSPTWRPTLFRHRREASAVLGIPTFPIWDTEKALPHLRGNTSSPPAVFSSEFVPRANQILIIWFKLGSLGQFYRFDETFVSFTLRGSSALLTVA